MELSAAASPIDYLRQQLTKLSQNVEMTGSPPLALNADGRPTT